MNNLKLPKTARLSVEHFIDGTAAVRWHQGMYQRRQRYPISAGNDQNNLRGEDIYLKYFPLIVSELSI